MTNTPSILKSSSTIGARRIVARTSCVSGSMRSTDSANQSENIRNSVVRPIAAIAPQARAKTMRPFGSGSQLSIHITVMITIVNGTSAITAATKNGTIPASSIGRTNVSRTQNASRPIPIQPRNHRGCTREGTGGRARCCCGRAAAIGAPWPRCACASDEWYAPCGYPGCGEC